MEAKIIVGLLDIPDFRGRFRCSEFAIGRNFATAYVIDMKFWYRYRLGLSEDAGSRVGKISGLQGGNQQITAVSDRLD